jgi:hypothetical protein
MRRGRTDEQRYVIISLYFYGRIKMNGPYPEIISHLFPLLLIGPKSRRDIHVWIKEGASERCDFSQFGKRQFSYGIYN